MSEPIPKRFVIFTISEDNFGFNTANCLIQYGVAFDKRVCSKGVTHTEKYTTLEGWIFRDRKNYKRKEIS